LVQPGHASVSHSQRRPVGRRDTSAPLVDTITPESLNRTKRRILPWLLRSLPNAVAWIRFL